MILVYTWYNLLQYSTIEYDTTYILQFIGLGSDYTITPPNNWGIVVFQLIRSSFAIDYVLEIMSWGLCIGAAFMAGCFCFHFLSFAFI